jgi:hypothetical protein
MVVTVNPDAKFESCVLDGFEAVAPCKFFFEGFDESFAEYVLLRGVRCDVFLLESVVVDYGMVLARAKDESIVMMQHHAYRSVAQGAEAS